MKNYFKNNPYKLTHDAETGKIAFVPQNELDKIETQALANKLNNMLKDVKSESALNAKSFSQILKEKINEIHLNKQK